jgi:two-component system sensor histidine kinase ArlS
MEQIAKDKNISIELSIDKSIILYGDKKKIDQIYRIFIDNAIKYSNHGNKIEITATDNYYGDFNKDNKNGVLVQFKDKGIGISKKDLPHIFERFFRSDQVSDTPGTGLGLSIAKELISLHLGSIYVESEYGKGSTFSVFFPRHKSKI